MSDPAPLCDHDDPAAFAQAALRRQVVRVDALAEAGLRMALAVERQVAEAPDPAQAPAGAVTAFTRLAKTVRLCGLLQSRLLRDMDDAFARARRHAPEREALARIAAQESDPARDHKARVERIVERQLKARHRDDEETVERLMLEACDRLDDDDIYRDVQTRPVGELVARICRDLGIDPDWDRLSQEAWAVEEAGMEGSPFNTLSSARPPPFAAANGGGGPPAERSEQPVVAGESHRTALAEAASGWQSHADPDPYP